MAAESDAPERGAGTEKLWNETGIDPVELHLGKDSGYTLRAYRMSDTLPGAKAEEPEPDEAEDDDEDAPEAEADADAVPEDPDADEPDPADFEDEAPEDGDEEEDALDAEPEEVPVFLTRKGKLLVFREPAALVAYVRDNDDHDLAAVDEYADLQERVTEDDIVCDEADIYELDLVVANLRGGQEGWEPELLIKAAEVGRDLGYALKNDSIVSALAPGSPLDDLDEAFRVVAEGGLKGRFAKRRLKRSDPQQAAIAWRGVIAKINDHVEWRG
ncbi:DNA primase [Glycomyces terrestris]|uniref:DNA primase n=1 Tax=Glycomyces terrestris TaxID=2493553 RepID=A0A426USN2_9ACTN|nr:DNA primase [Glycomyces terrestris]RRR96528.1 DNA primase [Glycomyces terrestris]